MFSQSSMEVRFAINSRDFLPHVYFASTLSHLARRFLHTAFEFAMHVTSQTVL